MELEPISSSCCSSSSSGEEDTAAANMTEMEAAEALADLAQLAIMREEVFESAASWGSKGKRVRKRVKTESPPSDSLLKPPDSETLPTPDLAEERLVKEEEEEEVQPITKAPVKTEMNGETPKLNLASTLRCSRSNGCGRSRQNLSEAEREERRIRRILANRESARQTIRRRQAMCEELSKKAADLTYENENLRREKDWALKEFQSLETINKHLKEQVSKSVKPDTKEPEESTKPSQVDMSTSSTPFYFYNQNPYQLFCWPHVTQSSNPTISPLEFATSGGPSAKSMTSQEHENPADDNGQKTHFYVVPCPWFLPPPDQSNSVPFGLQNTQRGTFSNGHHIDDSSARPIEVTETPRSHLPTRIKEEDSGSPETRPLYDLNESATEVLSEGGDDFPITQQDYSLKHEDVSETTNGVTLMPPGHHVLISLPGKKQGSLAAAEARKRRKELTRLKNLHGRQCRMQVG
ncbi:unnamed protein product [Arabidopsis lyrata]|uniref:uncharacterized protein LOC9326406 n=1 Tax=Arabidopsis lyrata subsp. lyrata TaxID=81972 RepID=UPI000A29E0A3|nr:uncharacterized protein LOC9326406 [Arabidopsis lyrata subsp. lyrata]CAH8252858.1 unnamed protein product [Arabidopsis lyrata]|eukprot:XP_020870087.1 uncharacterized protein LOC9326406 [Arabidopsis lyrata subsp. lyrata]